MTKEQLDVWFTFHPATPADGTAYDALRSAGHEFAKTILKLTPQGEDQEVAIRKVREAVMTANAAIACRDRS